VTHSCGVREVTPRLHEADLLPERVPGRAAHGRTAAGPRRERVANGGEPARPRLARCALCAALVCAVASLPARAQAPLETTVVAEKESDDEGRAVSAVSRRDQRRRQPRSAPDALRYEPGVFVQQTAHGQGSAYIRGLTGQQTLLEFDGIRINTSTFRQGPNQYFFTFDLQSIERLEVLRGGASTEHGSDALGGVIMAVPLESTRSTSGTRVEPTVMLRGATADLERGGRLQLDLSHRLQNGTTLSLLGGVGTRRAGLLTGPPVLNPVTSTPRGALPWVPRYAEYDASLPFDAQPALRTQLGTGFSELTGDARAEATFRTGERLTLAAYFYRQFDSPRTDQCPAPAAPAGECLTYERQFRTLVYGAWEKPLDGLLSRLRATVSWQQQSERRRHDFTSANLVERGDDVVDTLGVSLRAQSARLKLLDGPLVLSAGGEVYVDFLRSSASVAFTDTGVFVVRSRGQYLEGSRAATGGLFAVARWNPRPWLTLRGGLRPGFSTVYAPADPSSGASPTSRLFPALVGHVGVELGRETLRGFLTADRSFRAPNLDDLTARQATGPGFQFENPLLGPETAYTIEAGLRLRHPRVFVDAWLFATWLEGAVTKVSKSTADCPPATPACSGAWSQLRLENAPALSELRGVELSARVLLPLDLSLRATAAATWSEGPALGVPGFGAPETLALTPRVPLSRTPPVNGTAELTWAPRPWLGAIAALQWAGPQERLALTDYADGRIPRYGTPGFAVVHLRAWVRLAKALTLVVGVENLLDSPWRFHGSSINGPGRSVTVSVDLGRAFGGRSPEASTTPEGAPPSVGSNPKDSES
jgi:outer membrane receptor protein involved in Fe transport